MLKTTGPDVGLPTAAEGHVMVMTNMRHIDDLRGQKSRRRPFGPFAADVHPNLRLQDKLRYAAQRHDLLIRTVAEERVSD